MLFKQHCLALLISGFLASTPGYAAITLIAKGSIDAAGSDKSSATAGTLENNTIGNPLGGLGSGLAHLSGNLFIGLPDRGPNAISYNAGLDNTTSYVNRLQKIELKLKPTKTGSLPFLLTPKLVKTTLLYSTTALTYGSGMGFGVSNGAPSINTSSKYFFTGRSDNFNISKNSSNPDNGRFDPEGIRVSKDKNDVFISDEYGPYIYQFDRNTGQRVSVFTLPTKFSSPNLNAVGDSEITGNITGRVANKGMEGLAITPDGNYLVGIMQSPLIQDGGTNAAYTRIVKINIATGLVNEYAYPLDNIGTVSNPKYTGVSEILAINDNEFLIDERDGKGLGDNSAAVVKKLYRINLSNAQDVGNITGSANLASKAISKTLFLDLVAALNANGIASIDIPAKIEGMAWGKNMTIDHKAKRTLFIANDNDFLSAITDSKHPSGIQNPNQFFVFAVDFADLGL